MTDFVVHLGGELLVFVAQKGYIVVAPSLLGQLLFIISVYEGVLAGLRLVLAFLKLS